MINDTDVLDRTHFSMTARQSMATKKKAYDMGQLIDSRDRRRIVGDYMLTTQDILTARTFPDTISHHRSNFDAGALAERRDVSDQGHEGTRLRMRHALSLLDTKRTGGPAGHRTGHQRAPRRNDPDPHAAGPAEPGLRRREWRPHLRHAKPGGLVRKIDIKDLQNALVSKGCLQRTRPHRPRLISDER